MIAVDTNIILYLHVTSDQTSLALGLLEKEPSWITVPLWQSEFRNALLLFLRKGLLSLPETRMIMDEALLSMAGKETSVSSSHILELAASSSCSAYDCEFVALAQSLGIPLVTNDKQILNEFPGIAVSLKGFVER